MKYALLMLAALPAFAAIDGTVVNQTTGKPQPNTILMLMQPGQGGMQQLGTAKTDAQGNFHFDKSPEGPKLLQAIYAGVLYTQMIPPGSPTTGVQVAVYDATKDAKLDHPAQHLIVLQPTGSELDVTETFIFDNQTKTTFNSPTSGSAQVWVPEGAPKQVPVRITPPGGMPLDRTASPTAREHVYKIDYPINPGETRFDVNYPLPNATPLVFNGRVLDTSAPLRLVVPNGVTLQSNDLQLLGQEPSTQASIYNVKGASFSAQVQGTGTLGSGQDQQAGSGDDNGSPKIEEIQPRIYDRLYWLLGLMFGILALGSMILWRRDAARSRQ
ncbi:MAG TPA: hypothetical protein VFA04_25530 [Bryobacteraceae bacterium]|nr:hypothetical protein [Bryobacteraceae bacterium]